MKKWILFVALLGSASLVAALVPRKPHQTARRIASGVPWNGGKQHGPFELHSSFSNQNIVAPDREHKVDLDLIFQDGCEKVSTRVRTLGGIQLLSKARFDFESCPSGEVLANPVTIRLPEGTRGHVVIDVSYISKGKQWNETRAIELSDQKGQDQFLRAVRAQAEPAAHPPKDPTRVNEETTHESTVRVHQADVTIQ